ncbi:MAG: bifunctional DNA-formamidopyrimidine glycosylase/DNA-(apurinic or apyrimidinic site) lyase [Thermoanaerobaculia bacterium]|nr:bifunctional DNA-formamidopyrimidine glycosylase/DNA-(apurinic or apyrimidinic site) lyase [Thermoanaerobaculia bacterium]
MPELPEVEVLRRSLAPRLEGRRVEGVEVRESRLREPVSRRALDRLCGSEFAALRRRAKYLLADLTGGRTLVVHLGMSGRLSLLPGERQRGAHEHVVLALSGDEELVFRDPRRFGLIVVLPTDELTTDRRFVHLGLEPLDETFDGDRLAALARGRRGPVKNFLMNGRLVVGVGNIYASEALFRAGIHPRRSVARIAPRRWRRLAAAVQSVLAGAIEQGGTTLNDFEDAVGQAGYFQVSLEVYGRRGEPCKRCGRPVRRLVQAGRSTFYCPGCQR